MTLTATVPMMAAEPKTKTIRVPGDIADMLQTIASLKQEMGERFKSVEHVADLLKPVRQLHEETVEKYTAWKKQQRKGK